MQVRQKEKLGAKKTQGRTEGDTGGKNQPETEADRSRWRGGGQELCPMPCSLALYAARPPQGSQRGREGRQKGQHQTRKAPHQWHRGRVDTEHMGDARNKAFNRTKQNTDKEKKITVSWCSESGIWPHTGERRRGGSPNRREGASRVSLPKWQGTPCWQAGVHIPSF